MATKAQALTDLEKTRTLMTQLEQRRGLAATATVEQQGLQQTERRLRAAIQKTQERANTLDLQVQDLVGAGAIHTNTARHLGLATAGDWSLMAVFALLGVAYLVLLVFSLTTFQTKMRAFVILTVSFGLLGLLMMALLLRFG